MSIVTARIPRIACAGLLALLAAAACAKPSPGTTGSTQSQLTDHTTARTGVPCALPPAAPFDSSPWMGGPALTALSGGAARQSFSLDSGALTIEPPRQTDIPSVPIGQAKCDAFASDAAIGNFAGGGLAIGYGRVTVRRDLLGGQTVQVVNDADTVAPTLPASPTYLDRLAWVLVVRSQFAVPCPMQVNPPPTPDARPTDYDYQVFLLDATTGGAALTYTEGRVAPCDPRRRDKPFVAVPTDWVSVPWTLASRDKDGYSARITAQMASCDGYDTLVLPDAYRTNYVQVLVQRPIGVACEAAKHTLTLHAAEVTSDLPKNLVHAPTGLAFPWAYVQPGSAPPSTGTLLTIEADQCGKHINVDTDTVLVLPLVSSALGKHYPVHSSAPRVVGPLDGGSDDAGLDEVRAWSAGQADITVTGQVDGAPSTCARPWTLHVSVH